MSLITIMISSIVFVTGGLAAPALAAVAGSVATTIGGSAAAATAVTGMMGSSVGAASMIAGFGYYGGRVTAEHMARRIGELAVTCNLCCLLSSLILHPWSASVHDNGPALALRLAGDGVVT